MKNGKTIFEEERQFLKLFTGVEIPKNCWRNGLKIYLDPTCEKPIYTIKLEDKKKELFK